MASFCIEGSFQDPHKIKELASISDVITTEIEHVNTDILEELEKAGYVVRPNARTVRLIQDKYAQKVHLAKHDIAVPDFMSTADVQEAREAGLRYGYPFVLKNRRLAYDGRGNYVVKSEEDLPLAFDTLGSSEIYAEKWVPFVKELAVMVVRTKDQIMCYPVVETVQQDSICHLVTAPAQISQTANQHAVEIATKAVSTLDGIGIYGVELFLLTDDTVVVNELAPRPHNSGHYTIEACDIDQFEMHLRAVLDLPCPAPSVKVGAAMM
ncbi:ATP-grasp domain-containing protein, partial [archaeon]